MGKSDRDISQWDARLKEQLERSFHNYHKRRIDLSVARDNKQFDWTGEILIVEKASSSNAIATVRLMFVDADPLTLEKNVEIKSIFNRLYLSNDALAGEWLDVIAGINFEYKKKIVNSCDGPFTFQTGGPLTTPAGVDLRLIPGAGGITQIGDAGSTLMGLNKKDDFFVSGRFEGLGLAYFENSVFFLNSWSSTGIFGETLTYDKISEEITIAIGNSSGVSIANMAPANSIIDAVAVIVTQAPGGGPSHFDLGRTGGGNLDEYIDNQVVTLGGRFNIAAHGDGSIAGPEYNAANDTITITTTDGAGTPVNVTVADMNVRVVVWYKEISPPII